MSKPRIIVNRLGFDFRMRIPSGEIGYWQYTWGKNYKERWAHAVKWWDEIHG